MIERSVALLLGLQTEAVKRNETYGANSDYQLGMLASLVARLIAGTPPQKRRARDHIKKLIVTGNRNAPR